jgi:hypothetical protein
MPFTGSGQDRATHSVSVEAGASCGGSLGWKELTPQSKVLLGVLYALLGGLLLSLGFWAR